MINIWKIRINDFKARPFCQTKNTETTKIFLFVVWLCFKYCSQRVSSRLPGETLRRLLACLLINGPAEHARRRLQRFDRCKRGHLHYRLPNPLLHRQKRLDRVFTHIFCGFIVCLHVAFNYRLLSFAWTTQLSMTH